MAWEFYVGGWKRIHIFNQPTISIVSLEICVTRQQTISEERQNLATQFETGTANQMAAFDQEPITRFRKMLPSRSTLMSKYGNGWSDEYNKIQQKNTFPS